MRALSWPWFSDPNDLSKFVANAPECLWAKHGFDVGKMSGALPVQVTPKSTHRPYETQYHMSRESQYWFAFMFKNKMYTYTVSATRL